MAYLPKMKIFSGKRYRLHDDYLKQSTANWEADKLRSKGWNVRIIRLLSLFGVYKRR